MTVWQAIILGIVQGATEFIPVSSSGHLVLVPWLLGWEPPGLTFTVAVHLGTITAILGYFWRDFWAILTGIFQWLQERTNNPGLTFGLLIFVSALPAAVLGIAFEDFFTRVFESPLVAALMLSVTAALLIIGERIGRLEREIEDMTFFDALFIGLGQALAIMPGISRSGATIAAGRSRNMQREAAARFSFIMSTPVILGAGLLQVLELTEVGLSSDGALVLVAGFISAGVSSYLVIRWLLAFLKTQSTAVFAIYCVIASVFSLAVVFLRG